MKIVHFHPSSRMGHIFVQPLIDFEKSLGHESQLITFNKNFQSQNIFFDLRLISPKMLIDAFKCLFFLKKQKPDIIFCHNSTQAIIPLIISKVIKVKKIIYFNHGITYLGYSGLLKYLFFQLEKLNALFSDTTITVSPYMKNILDKIKPDTYVIYNGSACGIKIDNTIFNMNKKDKLSKKYKVISFVGRLHVRKGIFVLKKILNYFNDSNDVRFQFFGFTEDEFFNFSKIKYKNLKCYGFVKDTSLFLRESDILILPSLHEGLPYSLLEGMMYQNLIMANNVKGINDLIKNGYNGFLIKDNNFKAYISLIKDYIDNKIDTKKILQNSLKVLKKYNRSKFMLHYMEFLNKIEK